MARPKGTQESTGTEYTLLQHAGRKQPKKVKRRANSLSGAEWTRLSISVWRGIQKTREEKKWNHPAMFPVALVERLIRCFMSDQEEVVLDPFVGSGSTVVAARNCGKYGIGLDVSEEYLDIARARLSQTSLAGRRDFFLANEDARNLTKRIPPDTVDFCLTSPPYWDILDRPRTADGKETRTYGKQSGNIALIPDYHQFVEAVAAVFKEVLVVLKPGRYCIVDVMDIRKGNRFYPFHMDLSVAIQEVGFILDDMLIWDRSHEYNNLRPLGYPSVFRINRVHEYLLIFLKSRG